MNFRPAGMSDDDSESDDDYYEKKPRRHYYQPPPENQHRKQIEMNLQNAIINGNLPEVEKIIENDLNNNINDKMDTGWTPLMHACFHAQDKIVEFLLKKGADANQHSDSVIPIMLACSNSGASNEAVNNIVDQLIEKGSLLNIGDKYGQTPLMRAISSGRMAVVEKLLDKKVNIEMRDQKGWTAVFMAVHHDQAEILELLISHGARLTEVDKHSRSLLDIASSQDLQGILEILEKHLNIDKDDELVSSNACYQFVPWQDFYPGVNSKLMPEYKSEVQNLLYGMSCERLWQYFQGMPLKQFLLLEEKDMLKLGIDLPYQRQRLKMGLRNFHTRKWKLNAVAGLYAVKKDNYAALDCLTSLGSHLQQMYILEATLQYTLRSYNKIQDQIKYEPPDSPFHVKMDASSKKMLNAIKSIRKEIKTMKKLLAKISRSNPLSVGIIKEPSTRDVISGYITKAIFVGSLAFVCFKTGFAITNSFKNL